MTPPSTQRDRWRSHVLAYVVNLALLTTHQVDAAFQHEWNLFGIPGGIRFFLFFNCSAVLLLLWGLVQLALQSRRAPLFVYLSAGTGLATFSIHIALIALGHPEFRDPPSLLILALILVSSIAQLTLLHRRGQAVRGEA